MYVQFVQGDFLSRLGAAMDHLLACDCFTHEPWIASQILSLIFLFFSILMLAS